MSAYGTLKPLEQSSPLQSSTIYPIRRKKHPQSTNEESRLGADPKAEEAEWTHVAVFHLTLPNVPPELVDTMFQEFSDELERDDARTYPQEKGMTKEEFVAYYFARDVFLGIGVAIDGESTGDGAPPTLEDARGNRDWKSAVAGFYYIKPNYPGHSSHLCNAGFVIPYSRRGLGLGYIMGTSFLHYAPALGYRGSVFNLVYADNPASLRIWDALGFQRVGCIPGAGERIRTVGEERREEVYHVDAHVVYKSFV